MRTGIRILLLAFICDLDHLCFRRTTYDNINGPGGTIHVVIFGPAGPLMYPDQISCYRTRLVNQTLSSGWCLSFRDYKCPLRKGLEIFHSMTCSTDMQILCIVDWH